MKNFPMPSRTQPPSAGIYNAIRIQFMPLSLLKVPRRHTEDFFFVHAWLKTTMRDCQGENGAPPIPYMLIPNCIEHYRQKPSYTESL